MLTGSSLRGCSPTHVVVTQQQQYGYQDSQTVAQVGVKGRAKCAIRIYCNPLSLALAPGSSFKGILSNRVLLNMNMALSAILVSSRCFTKQSVNVHQSVVGVWGGGRCMLLHPVEVEIVVWSAASVHGSLRPGLA
jgi:hypothetical protein